MAGRQLKPLEAVVGQLARRPGLSKYHLLNGLVSQGLKDLTLTDINRLLYARADLFVRYDTSPPTWALAPTRPAPALVGSADNAATAAPGPEQAVETPDDQPAEGPPVPTEVAELQTTGPFTLRAWQQDAFSAWITAGRTGVVEAVTGTGKTAVGVAAVADVLRRGGRATVLVPGLDLLDQWAEVLERRVPGAVVGRRGGGYLDTSSSCDVLVTTVHSADRSSRDADGRPALVVADEVRRYGSASFAAALHSGYNERLGLTATYERSDDGVATVLQPYFRSLIPGCDYARGRADGILAPVRVMLVGVSFSAGEQGEFAEWDEQARSERTGLINRYGCPPEPFGQFFRDVQNLSDGPGSEPSTWAARRYLKAFSQRRQLLAACAGKRETMSLLAPALAGAGRSLVFSETTQSAEQAAEALTAGGLLTRTFSSELVRSERRELLEEFRAGTVPALAAPRVLDEGIDVPEADVGIVLAASRSRRQMVQRMGRIVRPKADGRAASFLVVYVRGSSEDPDRGVHEGFLEQLLDIATEVTKVDAPEAAARLHEWLTTSPVAPEPAPFAAAHSAAADVTVTAAPNLARAAMAALAKQTPARRPPAKNKQKQSLAVRGPSLAPAAIEPAIVEPTLLEDADAGEQTGAIELLLIPGVGPQDEKDAELTASADSVRAYLKQIGKVALLNAEEEVELAKRIEAGLYSTERMRVMAENGEKLTVPVRRDLTWITRDGNRAKNHLLEANLRLVVSLAKRYTGRGMAFLDLIQEGNLGLIRAVEKFDYMEGTKFSTYATWWIRQGISRGLADQSRTIRIPVHAVEDLERARGIEAQMTREQGTAPTLAEVAAKAELAEEKLRLLRIQDLPVLDLDARRPCNPSEGQWDEAEGWTARRGDRLPVSDQTHDHDQLDDRFALLRALGVLDARSARILLLRHGLAGAEPATLDEIGREYGVTRERIRQLEKAALTRLRQADIQVYLQESGVA